MGARNIRNFAAYLSAASDFSRKEKRRAFAGQPSAQAPQRMHSGLLGLRSTSTPMGHARTHRPQSTHFSRSTRSRRKLKR